MQHILKSLSIDPKWLPVDMPADELKQRLSVRFSRPEKRRLKKRKMIPPSVWAERHIEVPKDSDRPGKYRNRTTPYLAGIMDASFFPSVQEIICCAPPQTGKTLVSLNCIMYATDRKPGNVYLVFQDEKTAKDINTDKLQPILLNSPRMRSYLTPYRDDLAATKIKLEHVNYYLAWASSVGQLASRSAPYGLADEEDKYPPTASKKEAGPVDLLRKRARTYRHMRKLWRISSPSIVEGPIWQALYGDAPDAEVVFLYWTKCPECNGYQVMKTANVKFPKDERDPKRIEKDGLAWYACEHCQAQWNDAMRDQAVQAGEWRSQDKGILLDAYLKSQRPLKIGFHYNALISTFVTLSEYAAAFLKGLNDFIAFKDFKNGYEAVPWEERGERPAWQVLKTRMEAYSPRTVPQGGLFLTASVDVQRDRLEAIVKAWGRGEESWLIRHEVIYGDPQGAGVWTELDKILFGAYQHEGGVEMQIMSAGLDASDGVTTQAVRRYCYKHRHTKMVFALKGASQANKPIIGRPTYVDLTYSGKPIKEGVQLWPVGTDIAKSTIYRRLDIETPGPGYMHFYQGLPDDYFEQLVAETLITEKDPKGYPRIHWKLPAGRRNEALDLEVYAYAAAVRIGLSRMRDEDWDELEQTLVSTKQNTDEAEAIPQVRSNFMS